MRVNRYDHELTWGCIDLYGTHNNHYGGLLIFNQSCSVLGYDYVDL